MITGVHALIFTPEAEAVRGFFRDVLGFGSVDAGEGWPIFRLPPAELGVHPDEGNRHELYLMCDDVEGTVRELRAKGVRVKDGIVDAGFGRVATIELPGGGDLPIYEPRHPKAIDSAG